MGKVRVPLVTEVVHKGGALVLSPSLYHLCLLLHLVDMK